MRRNDDGDKMAMNMMVLGGITTKVLNLDLLEEETAGAVSNLTVKAADSFTKKGKASESEIIENIVLTYIRPQGFGCHLNLLIKIFSKKNTY